MTAITRAAASIRAADPQSRGDHLLGRWIARCLHRHGDDVVKYFEHEIVRGTGVDEDVVTGTQDLLLVTEQRPYLALEYGAPLQRVARLRLVGMLTAGTERPVLDLEDVRSANMLALVVREEGAGDPPAATEAIGVLLHGSTDVAGVVHG